MPLVIVDGKEIEIGAAEKLNGIQAAARVGVDIPHYCWHPGLSVVASCRMCLVEAGKKDPATGKITMGPKPVPACQTPATDGTVFITNSPQIENARALVEEDLLIRHPIDCPICDKAGECRLQDYHFAHGREQRRADIKPFTSRRRELGDTVTLFVDRCVMCTRCVRFCREVAGTSELMIENRGAHEEINVLPGFPLENKLSGNVVDLCPVGALGDLDFLYQQRVWFMRDHAHVCGGCSTGCAINVEENQDRIYRLKPRENPHVNGWWMCDEGRYGWKHVHDANRNQELRRRDGLEYVNVEWSALPEELTGKLRGAGRLAIVLSPHLTCEEAYLLATFIKSVDAEAVVAMGPVPVVGEDERFKGGFTIHAEKAPNRRGVEAVAARANGSFLNWNDFLPRVAAGEFGGVWVTGGYPAEWIDDATAAKFGGVKLLVVQDLFPSPLWQRAAYQIPGAAYPEREGSFVNFNDHLQSFPWAIRAPAGVKTEGQLAWQLAGRTGLYKARAVMDDLAREIAFFAAALEAVPEHGVDLKIVQLATT